MYGAGYLLTKLVRIVAGIGLSHRRIWLPTSKWTKSRRFSLRQVRKDSSWNKGCTNGEYRFPGFYRQFSVWCAWAIQSPRLVDSRWKEIDASSSRRSDFISCCHQFKANQIPILRWLDFSVQKILICGHCKADKSMINHLVGLRYLIWLGFHFLVALLFRISRYFNIFRFGFGFLTIGIAKRCSRITQLETSGTRSLCLYLTAMENLLGDILINGIRGFGQEVPL